MKVTLFFLCIIGLMACQTSGEKVHSSIAELTRSGEFNGYLLVEFQGKKLFDQSVRSLSDSLMTPGIDSPVYLASLTKLFTELIILKLAEEKMVFLDSSIHFHRNSFKSGFGKRITIRQLVEMRSGLPRELDENTAAGLPLDKAGMAGPYLDSIPDFRLQFEPGTDQSYSNLNYWILGSVIEAVTESSVDEAYSKYLFNPLEMHHSGYFIQDFEPMKGYKKEDGRWVEDQFEILSRYTSGGCYSSVSDLQKLNRALGHDGFISPELKSTLQDANKRIEVYGSLPGYTNMLVFDTQNELMLIMLNNVGITSPNDLLKLKEAVYQDLGITGTAEQKKRKVTLKPVHELADSISLERGMKDWINAIESKSKDDIINVLLENSIPGSIDPQDASWSEIISLSSQLKGFRSAGYRWVKNENPAGLEVWFVCEGPEKIAFLWIPSNEDPDLIEALMIKPDDMKWMGEEY
jgi:hypothetical protein